MGQFAEISHELRRLSDRVAIIDERLALATPLTRLTMAERLVQTRGNLNKYLGADLFADPARDILLDLYACEGRGQRVSVSSCCIAACVPPTTALRWIKTLVATGLLVRVSDPHDGRRIYLSLSDRARAGLEVYLSDCLAAFT